MTGRELHLDLLSELADELRVNGVDLVVACDEEGAQAVECDWEDEWPTRTPRTKHGRKGNAVADRLGLGGERVHVACKAVGILFVQAGDRRAGTTAFFR